MVSRPKKHKANVLRINRRVVAVQECNPTFSHVEVSPAKDRRVTYHFPCLTMDRRSEKVCNNRVWDCLPTCPAPSTTAGWLQLCSSITYQLSNIRFYKSASSYKEAIPKPTNRSFNSNPSSLMPDATFLNSRRTPSKSSLLAILFSSF
jgi:hypothetical protein